MKGMPRVAHMPTDEALLRRPIIPPDAVGSSKVPSNVRQRYLDSIVDECLKLHIGNRQAAYERALKEEEVIMDSRP